MLDVVQNVFANLRSVVIDVNRMGRGFKNPVIVQVSMDLFWLEHSVFC